MAYILMQLTVDGLQMRTKRTFSQASGQCDKDANLNYKVCDDAYPAEGIMGRCTVAECKALCEVYTGFNCRYYSYEAADSECYLFNDCQKLDTTKSLSYMSYRLDGTNFYGEGDLDANETDDIYTMWTRVPRCHGWQDNNELTKFGAGPDIIADLARLCTLLVSYSYVEYSLRTVLVNVILIITIIIVIIII